MSRRCQLSGKGPLVGNNVSHANNKTKRRQLANIHTKRIYVPELDQTVKVKISRHAMRCIDKMGLLTYLRKNNIQLKDITP